MSAKKYIGLLMLGLAMSLPEKSRLENKRSVIPKKYKNGTFSEKNKSSKKFRNKSFRRKV